MKPSSRTAAYVLLYPQLAEVARAFGYALAIHGSMNRDMDLVAIPWTERAVDPFTLVNAMKEAVGGWWWGPDVDQWYPDGMPTRKPHGRMAYSIHLTDRGSEGPYLDVSVIPREEWKPYVAPPAPKPSTE